MKKLKEEKLKDKTLKNVSGGAHKEGAGSSKNGRDSDDKLFAKVDGVVRFNHYGRDKK